jgi:hypothetical protein
MPLIVVLGDFLAHATFAMAGRWKSLLIGENVIPTSDLGFKR